PHGGGGGVETGLPVRVMPGPPVNVGWQGTAVWPLQQFCDRPPLESAQMRFAAFVGSGPRATQEPPVQLPGALAHFVPPQASSCAGTPLDSWSRHGLEPPVPGVVTVPVVGASWMSSWARNWSCAGGRSRG